MRQIANQQVKVLPPAPEEPKRSKYGNTKRIYRSVQGFERVYDSIAEARYAEILDANIQSGAVLWWIPQVRFPLPGGVSYRCDFIAMTREGSLRIIDRKGFFTQESRNKIKQVEALYAGVTVEIVGSK
jgi:hypothetical protein